MADVMDFGRAGQALLPAGEAWSRNPQGLLGRLIAGLFAEHGRVAACASGLADEFHPGTAQALLPEWERDYGLPDSCAGGTYLSDRRGALLARFNAPRDTSLATLVRVAAQYGYPITIVEPEPTTVSTPIGGVLRGSEWRWAFEVHADAVVIRRATVSDNVSAPLSWQRNEGLECLIHRYRAAGRKPVFIYQ